MTNLTIDPIAHLHPRCREMFRNLAHDLHRSYEDSRTHTLFRPFEGFRSPIKQNELFNQRPVVTKASQWQSPHQYGLACDFVAFSGGKWSWDEKHDWAYLRLAAERNGLRRPLEWDLGHIEHPLWERVQTLLFAR